MKTVKEIPRGSLRSLGVIDYPSKGGVRLAAMFDSLSN
jgi:hypothetical protein